MFVFKYRSVSHEPDVVIIGNSIKHVLSSRFFKTWTYDGMFEVVAEGESVRLRNKSSGNTLGSIGSIKEEVGDVI